MIAIWGALLFALAVFAPDSDWTIPVSRDAVLVSGAIIIAAGRLEKRR